MKKVLALTMAMAMVLALASCGSKGSASSKAGSSSNNDASSGSPSAITTVEPGKLHMSTNAQFPPYEMVADDGSYEGIDVEVAGLIAEKLGLELVVDDMGFTACLEAVQNGKSDIAMAGITVNKERLANMDFTDSYATGVQVIVVPENSPITSPDDLANAQQIGTQEGTTGYYYCSSAPEDGGYGEDHVITYESGAVAIQSLLAGKVDCVVIDQEPAKAYVAANPGLKILETEFTIEDYAIAVQKGNDAMKTAINQALSELIADGSVQKVVDKYIKAN